MLKKILIIFLILVVTAISLIGLDRKEIDIYSDIEKTTENKKNINQILLTDKRNNIMPVNGGHKLEPEIKK